MYNLREYSDAYSKTSGSLRQYYRDEPGLDANDDIIDFPPNNNNSTSFRFILEITAQTGNDGTKDIEIMVPLKYISNFWKTFEMTLINCEISLQLKWSKNCLLVADTAANQNSYFEITDKILSSCCNFINSRYYKTP